MSLRVRILLVLSALVCAYVAIDHYLQRRILAPQFAALDRQQASENMQRNLMLIEAENEHLDTRTSELAKDPGVRSLFAGDATDFDPRRVLGDTFDMVCVARTDGEVLAHLALDRSGTEPTRTTLDRFPSGRIDPRNRFMRLLVVEDENGLEREEDSTSGFIDVNGKPMFVSSHPVIGEGAKRVGRVMLGRFLDDRLLTELGERIGQEISAKPLWDGRPLDVPKELVDEATGSTKPITAPLGDDRMASFAVLQGVDRQPLLLLETTVPRPIHAQGQAVIRYALFSTLAAGLILLLALVRLLEKVVLVPVGELTQHAVKIGEDDRTTARLESSREDELGVLAREFDSMMDKLADSRQAVVRAAHSAGMSEIATGILHNVGNVLNSVSIGSQLVDEALRQSKLPQFEKLVDLLKSHENDLAGFVTNDPRGAKLIPFLTALRTQLGEEQANAKKEMSKVLEGIAHISELVASQQAYAIRSSLKEVTDVRTVADRAVELTKSAGSMSTDIEIEREYDDVDEMALDPNKLLEILVNVIQNARQAMQGLEGRQPKLHVRIAEEEHKVRVVITDNGMGISPENLAKIFGHGFTTKRNGHGFGLHSAANAAVELGGRLFAESDGPGTGARFVLELPLPASAAKAA
ncbi:MAG: ATP-binding protein [Planctomycetota bacterium]